MRVSNTAGFAQISGVSCAVCTVGAQKHNRGRRRQQRCELMRIVVWGRLGMLADTSCSCCCLSCLSVDKDEMADASGCGPPPDAAGCTQTSANIPLEGPGQYIAVSRNAARNSPGSEPHKSMSEYIHLT